MVASWIRSAEECRFWSGSRVAYPIDLALLSQAIEYDESEAWSIEIDGELAAFGQLVAKPAGRVHLARLISAPHRRGQGLGRRISEQLVEAARVRNPAAISLNVIAENRAALSLYTKLGFVRASRPADEPASSAVYMEVAGDRTQSGS